MQMISRTQPVKQVEPLSYPPSLLPYLLWAALDPGFSVPCVHLATSCRPPKASLKPEFFTPLLLDDLNCLEHSSTVLYKRLCTNGDTFLFFCSSERMGWVPCLGMWALEEKWAKAAGPLLAPLQSRAYVSYPLQRQNLSLPPFWVRLLSGLRTRDHKNKSLIKYKPGKYWVQPP